TCALPISGLACPGSSDLKGSTATESRRPEASGDDGCPATVDVGLEPPDSAIGVTGAMKRYPRPGTVTRKRGSVRSSPSTRRTAEIAWLRFFLDHRFRPDRLHQPFLGHELASLLDEVEQGIERARRHVEEPALRVA